MDLNGYLPVSNSWGSDLTGDGLSKTLTTRDTDLTRKRLEGYYLRESRKSRPQSRWESLRKGLGGIVPWTWGHTPHTGSIGQIREINKVKVISNKVREGTQGKKDRETLTVEVTVSCTDRTSDDTRTGDRPRVMHKYPTRVIYSTFFYTVTTPLSLTPSPRPSRVSAT